MTVKTQHRVNFGFDRFSGLYLWAIFIIAFAIWIPRLFLTMATVHSVASEQAVTAMLALAVLIPLAAGAYDLSIGSVINLSTIIVVWLQTVKDWNMWPAIGIAIAASVIVGVVNGFVVVKLRVNSFIATLGMATVITAVQDIVSGENQPLPPTSSAWSSLTQRSVGGFEIIVLYLIVMAVIIWWAMDHTPVGRYLFAIGGNPDAARLSGVNVGRYTWLSLIASSTICGIAGVFYGSLTGPSLSFGEALLLPAFAAVFLGSTQLKPGRFNVWGTLIAIYVLATGVRGLQLITGVQWLDDMFNGVALIGAVAFATWRSRVSGGRAAAERLAAATRQSDASTPDSGSGDEAIKVPSTTG